MIEVMRSDHKENGKTIFVFFSGGWSHVQKKNFQFKSIAESLSLPSIFVRDLDGNFYNSENFQNALDEIKEHINKFCVSDMNESLDYSNKRVVFVGSSMGGYGAIKFINAGLRPDKAIVFGAQVSWHEPFAEDISKYFLNNPVPLDAYYCKYSEYKTDREHAEILARSPLTKVHSNRCDVHNIAAYLKDIGALKNILSREATGEN